jgi:hypothetical protein
MPAASFTSQAFSHQQLLNPAPEQAIVVRLADPLPSFGRRQGTGSRHGREMEAMKVLALAVAMTMAIVMPAYAQMGGGKKHQGDDKKTEQKPKVDDKAYKAALERIPDPKEKYDPWGVARPADAAKKPKQTP